MGYSIKWLIEQRIVFVEIVDVLTQSEARKLAQEITNHVESGSSPVHLIVGMTKLLLTPSNIQFNQEVIAPYIHHPNMGWVIIIGGNMITKFVGTVLCRLMKFKLKQVDHYDQAISALKEVDASLGDYVIE